MRVDTLKLNVSSLRVLIGAAVLLAASAAAAEPSVYRCEGKDGRVTYSDEACPTASRSVRGNSYCAENPVQS